MCRALLVGIALTALVGIPVAESQQCDVSLADADEFEERAMAGALDCKFVDRPLIYGVSANRSPALRADDIVWVLVFTSKKGVGGLMSIAPSRTLARY
jgi:hypothetical protein